VPLADSGTAANKVECLRWTVALKGISVASTTVGAERKFMLIVALALLFVIPPHVDAAEKGPVLLLPIGGIDLLLAVSDWLNPPKKY
jgi:hypothetical protein